MQQPIEICYFHWIGECKHGRYCNWKHVSSFEIDPSATYVFCSGVNHRRTPEQTMREIRGAYKPAPDSPKSRIRVIQYKTIEREGSTVTIVTHRTRKPFDEIRKKHEMILDAVYTEVDEYLGESIIQRETMYIRAEPMTLWADMDS